MSRDLGYKYWSFTKDSVCVSSMRMGREGKFEQLVSNDSARKKLNSCISGTTYRVLLDRTVDQAIC